MLFLDGTVTYNEEEQTVALDFPNLVTSPNDPIHIEYSGILNNQMRGFYRSKYNHPNEPKVDRYAAVTQFEVIYLILNHMFDYIV